MKPPRRCTCGNSICNEAEGYIFVDAGHGVCAAGCVHESVGEIALNTVFESHQQFEPSLCTNALSTSTRRKGSDRPLALRGGRVRIDLRSLSDIAHAAQIPEPVLLQAKCILEATYKIGNKDFKRRGMKRQALIVSIICMACDRSKVEHHGDRLRVMCERAIGQKACADLKNYAVFCRIMRAMGILLNRAMTVAIAHTAPEESLDSRILNNAWGRLGRAGMKEADIARVVNVAEQITLKWDEAVTKLGEGVVACAAHFAFGSSDERTAVVSTEYNYRKMTVTQHCKTITNFIPSNFS